MAKTTSRDTDDNDNDKDKDKLVYVRFDQATIRKLDRRVRDEKKKRSADVDAKAITRSSVVRSAVVKMLESGS